MSLDIIGPIMVMLADQATVPVAVHLDHGVDLHILKKALDMASPLSCMTLLPALWRKYRIYENGCQYGKGVWCQCGGGNRSDGWCNPQ